MHVHGIGWMHYDGARWCEDVRGIARREVLEVLRDALAESLGGDAALRRDVAKCESAAGIDGVLSIAASLVEFAATVDDLDADPYLVNTPAGTLDLQTGTVRAHDAGDRLTKITRGNYVPGHEPGAWATFLEQVLPDADERAYLARLVGQALYGRVTENVFPVLTGTGANGKSTATTALAFALGDITGLQTGRVDATIAGMNDTSPPPLFLNESPVAVPLPRVMQQAYLWIVAGLSGLATIALFVFAVATQSGADAERIAGAQGSGRSNLATLVGSLAAMHGRPGAL